MEMDIDWQIRPRGCMPMRTFLLCSWFCSLSGEDKSHRDENVISEANTPRRNACVPRVCRPPAGRGLAKVSVSKPDMPSNCFIRGRGNVIPAVHTPESLCARYEAGWMKNNVRTRSGTQLDSTSESRYVVSLTSSINITKICSSKAASTATELTAEGCCRQKTWRRTLSRWLKAMQIWLTGFHWPVITTLCIYTAKPLENLIKSAQIGNESSWYVPPFTSSHYSSLCLRLLIAATAHEKTSILKTVWSDSGHV